MTEPELTNEMVAEQVMGWTAVPGVGWRRDPLHIRHGSFKPLDNAGEDLVVFNHVREQIDDCNPQYVHFYEHLAAVLCDNSESGPRDPHAEIDQLCLLHWYRVGDYSRAAMAAVAARKERNNRGMLGSSNQKESPQ